MFASNVQLGTWVLFSQLVQLAVSLHLLHEFFIVFEGDLPWLRLLVRLVALHQLCLFVFHDIDLFEHRNCFILDFIVKVILVLGLWFFVCSLEDVKALSIDFPKHERCGHNEEKRALAHVCEIRVQHLVGDCIIFVHLCLRHPMSKMRS